METTRRGFLARGMRTAAAAAPLLAVPAEVAGAGAEPDRTEASFTVYPWAVSRSRTEVRVSGSSMHTRTPFWASISGPT